MELDVQALARRELSGYLDVSSNTVFTLSGVAESGLWHRLGRAADPLKGPTSSNLVPAAKIIIGDLL